MGKVRILGDGKIPEAAAFYDVRDAMVFDQDVTLLAHMAPILGIELKDEVIYNMEPLYDGCRSLSIGYMDILKRCHVIDYSRKNVEYLKRHGIEAFYMPYGYHDSLERAVPADKDIDVLFIGSINPRRSDIFTRLSKEINFSWWHGAYGEERDRLISRARVHVNVHYAEPHPLEVVRLNYLMANGCNIVSEYGDDDELNEEYACGMRFSKYEDIIETCKIALQNPIDGRECIKRFPHECGAAQQWLNTRMGQ